MIVWIGRLLWIMPAGLVALAANQAKVAIDLKATWETGQPAVAEVLAFETRNRADVTYGYLDLRVELGNGKVLTQEKMSLPQVFWKRIDDADSLAVRVAPGEPQPVVVDLLMPGHWLIAAAQVGICFLGALMSIAGLWAWHRQMRLSPTPTADS